MLALFTPRTLTFLRGLKRNNTREWFQAHRDAYERDVRAPLTALVERMAEDLPSFAPDLVAAPRLSIFRIHRDIRFSDDKSPYKTNIAAQFPSRRLPRNEGAGLYVQIAPNESFAGGGIYMPERDQLFAIREHIAENYLRFRALVESPRVQRRFGGLADEGRLTRAPKGFPVDHPAIEYLKHKHYFTMQKFPPVDITSPRFYPMLLAMFKDTAPLVAFLNEALTTRWRANGPALGASLPASPTAAVGKRDVRKNTASTKGSAKKPR